MKNTDFITNEREKNSDTLCWVLGFNYKVNLKVKKYVKELGIKEFLLKFQSLDFTYEEKEKIAVLKRVLEKFDGDIETINFGDEKLL
ncbi:MAG: hypothetical protein ACLKAK_11850 [Alkaliphilus sp.]